MHRITRMMLLGGVFLGILLAGLHGSVHSVSAGSPPVTTSMPSADTYTKYHNFYNAYLDPSPGGLIATSKYVASDKTMWATTGGFDGSRPYELSWTPPEIPPDNATILYVHMVVRAKVADVTPPYDSWGVNLTYATNETYVNVSGGTTSWTVGDDKTVVVNSVDFAIYHSNITSNETWTAIMLKSNLTWVNASVPIIWTEWEPDARLYVDYIGLEIKWCLGSAPGEEEEEEGGGVDLGDLTLTIPGMFGLVGFFGMIAVPAAGFWFLKNTGGSRLRAVIMIIMSFMFCFTMFLMAVDTE